MPKRALVVVDAGHGGADPGAVAGSARESDINLALALRFKHQAASLGYPFDVALLRGADVFVSLPDRVARANELAPACVLSFHCNAAGAPQATGYEVWTTPGETPADDLATYIYEELDNVAPYGGRPDVDDGDPDREARFYMLRHTLAPAVLVEFGFMTNQHDLTTLLDDIYQQDFVLAVAGAVQDWLEERGLV